MQNGDSNNRTIEIRYNVYTYNLNILVFMTSASLISDTKVKKAMSSSVAQF